MNRPGPAALRRVLAAALMLAAAGPGMSAAPAAEAAPRFGVELALADVGQVLARPALLAPARYRVLIVPGSGCRSLAPSVDRLAAGLAHAEVLVLQKPHLDAEPGDPAAPCPEAFVQEDRLSAWLAQARRLAAQALAQRAAALPLVLAGLSEGAELLPGLAAAFPQAEVLVMVGHAGLDPAEAGRQQAERLGAGAEWSTLMDAAAMPATPAPDAVLHGRHLRYWQDLHGWLLRQPLLDDPRPLLHAWGGQDALMPPGAYTEFAAAARHRAGGYCSLRFGAADHELRSAHVDDLQRVWHWLERFAREGRQWPAGCFKD